MSIAPRDAKYGQLLIALGRAVGRDAPGVGLALRLHQRVAARRAVVGEHPRLAVGRPHAEHRADHLGDHVTGLADDHGVTGSDVFDLHLLAVVQRRHPHRGSADEHRIEHGERCRPTGSPDRHLDVEQRGRAFLGRELVRDRPPRRPRRDAEHVALAEIVDLDDHTVDLVVEVVTMLLPVEAVRGDLVDRVERPNVFVDREPERAEVGQFGLVANRVGDRSPTICPS